MMSTPDRSMMTDAIDIRDWRCGAPTPHGPCEKHYCHVAPGHWAEPTWSPVTDGA